jgi:hypothetical protein
MTPRHRPAGRGPDRHRQGRRGDRGAQQADREATGPRRRPLALGRAAERVGDLETAKQSYGWFVAKPQDYLEKWQTNQKDPAFETAASVTTIGRAIDRWAALTGAYANNPALDKTLLNLFVAAYDRIDRGYWPAHLAAAEYFASHDKGEEAMEELKGGVLKQNPNSTEALKLLGLLMIATYNFRRRRGRHRCPPPGRPPRPTRPTCSTPAPCSAPASPRRPRPPPPA